MSVEFRKDLFADERSEALNEIGKPKLRQDIEGHVRGRTAYYDDHQFEGLLHMRCVRSPHHHARVRHIDVTTAERMPGVVRFVWPKDVPNNLNTLLSLIGFGRDDEQLISQGVVRYVGEPVLAIIAETEAEARAAAAAVRVDWEVLPHVLDVEAAIAPGAVSVNPAYPDNTFEYAPYDHVKLRFGDVHAAFEKADHLVEAEYEMSPIEQAPIETCGALAAPETADRIVCHTGTQALFFSLGTTAKLLDTPSSRLHFIGGTAGGGFGGKVDSITEPMAVLGVMLTGKPVKFQWDREEEMQVGAPRGAERWRLKDGVMADGRIIARSLTGFFDAGAYTRLSSYAGTKCTGHLPGPYTIPNVAANTYCVFTNRTPATAMRGFGITGVDFAIECHMDRVAEVVGLDPISLRILNSYRDGDMKAHRRSAKNCALVESCQVAAEKANWHLPATDLAQTSMIGSTPERAAIPETALDQEGRVGDRRAGRTQRAEPSPGTTRLPAGTHGKSHAAVPVQRPDMQILAERVGHAIPADQADLPAPVTQPTRQAASAPLAAPSAAVSRPGIAAPVAASPAPQQAAQEQPYRPEKPFQQGVKRPGVSRFLSGSRRR